MVFHIPPGMMVTGLGFAIAVHFLLLEAPLRQYHIAAGQQTVQVDMAKSEAGGQCLDLSGVLVKDVLHNLDAPVVLHIAHFLVSVSAHLPML